ncbi:hypothetical protein [Staphylococcus phage PT1-1]
MIILALDYSFSKTGIAIIRFKNNKPQILHTELFITDKNKDGIERISDTIDHIDKIRRKYKVDLTVKEGAIVGRASTSMPVHKAHGALEYFYFDNTLPLEEIHNATLKAWCRNYLIDNNYYTKDSLKQLNKKEIVAQAMLKFFDSYNIEEMIYTPRGKLLDDVADAIAIALVYWDRNLK